MAEARKVVVITGASGGIGAALARRLGADGHALVLAARRADALEAVARDASADALAVSADVTRRADVERIRDEALRTFGRVDVWVNNAGRGITRPVLELTDDDVDEMMSVNVKSALYGMQAIVPHFVERGRGAPDQRLFVPGARADGQRALRVQRGQGGAQLAHGQPADGPAPHRARRARVAGDAGPGGYGVRGEFARRRAAHGGRGHGDGRPDAGGGRRRDRGTDRAPRAELYTNPASPAIPRRYYEDVEAFEAGMPAPPR